MGIYKQKQRWKLLLLIIALAIGATTLFYTNRLVEKLSAEETRKVELWAEATRLLGSDEGLESDYSFLLMVIQNNHSVPVILTDSSDNIISHRNLDSLRSHDSVFLYRQLVLMKAKQDPIVIKVGADDKNYIYYRESSILLQLTYYPYIQLIIILVFVILGYIVFSTARNAEQNKVWIGLTKETAHQLGTPASSLMAWAELIKEQLPNSDFASEFEKDVKRLEVITERFSKIGSVPVLKPESLNDTVQSAIDYLRRRSSSKINFVLNFEQSDIILPLSRSLFEWVLENICKNAMDAIADEGTITISVQQNKRKVYLDISDTGKGIAKSNQKTIFKPGYTTKARGWGLGLSLVKRIVENYHKGKIFVLSSEPGKGTTFRIILKNQK